MRSPVADLLADLSRAFDALGISWYLFGAQAAIVYGVARLTADVDVTVRAPSTPTSEWLAVLRHHGFEPRFADPGFIEQTRVLPVTHTATGLPVDIVLAGPGLEEEFLNRAVVRSIDGVRVPVVEIADLVVLKVLASRPKDLEDVVMLMRVQGDAVDIARVRAVLSMLEAALGQSDLLVAFEQCQKRSAE
ncbi:MAG: nucleotidyltransferase [Acidobacteriota bacterium]|nr:nucleotidyltransferase [Acidobacteriota bacterium]